MVRYRDAFHQLNAILVPGDILYSSKGWSTFLVGHVGIVGEDMAIHHSHPRGGFSDTLLGYLSRHKFGGTITVYRPKTGARKAANWAQSNITRVGRYIFHRKLDNLYANYCSKFIWQAFWYSDAGDITDRGLTATKKSWVCPFHIKQSLYFEEVARINL